MIPNSLIFVFRKIKHTHAKMQALNCASNPQFVLQPKNYGLDLFFYTTFLKEIVLDYNKKLFFLETHHLQVMNLPQNSKGYDPKPQPL